MPGSAGIGILQRVVALPRPGSPASGVLTFACVVLDPTRFNSARLTSVMSDYPRSARLRLFPLLLWRVLWSRNPFLLFSSAVTSVGLTWSRVTLLLRVIIPLSSSQVPCCSDLVPSLVLTACTCLTCCPQRNFVRVLTLQAPNSFVAPSGGVAFMVCSALRVSSLLAQQPWWHFVRSAKALIFNFLPLLAHRNVPTSCHHDTNNFTDHNLVYPLSDFSGGSVWVQDPSGPVLRVHEGKQVASFTPCLKAPLSFRFASACISTEPWSGDRVVLIAYAGGDHNAMSVSDRTFLQELAFPLPSDSSTDSPPVPWHPSVPQELQPFLDKAKERVAGRPLGGLCSAVRRQGLLGSHGIDHQAHAGVKLPRHFS